LALGRQRQLTLEHDVLHIARRVVPQRHLDVGAELGPARRRIVVIVRRRRRIDTIDESPRRRRKNSPRSTKCTRNSTKSSGMPLQSLSIPSATINPLTFTVSSRPHTRCSSVPHGSGLTPPMRVRHTNSSRTARVARAIRSDHRNRAPGPGTRRTARLSQIAASAVTSRKPSPSRSNRIASELFSSSAPAPPLLPKPVRVAVVVDVVAQALRERRALDRARVDRGIERRAIGRRL
jgi:hypothetical protein